MSYVGNVPTTAAFPFDQFSGNGSTTAFTLSYAPAGSTSIIVSISGVVQNPNTYSVSGTTLTFTPAPPTGTNNIAVLYLGLPVVATLTPGNTAYFSSSVFTATASQTVFTPSGTYQVGFINVIRNGSQLAPADYTATNGTTVTLANPCTAGDTVVIEVFNLVSIANAIPATGGNVTGGVNLATASGNVGVGTSSPDSLSNFKFIDVGSSGTNQGVVQANNGTVKVAIYANSTEGYLATRTNHNLNLQTNGTTRATLDTSGNVGIGTSSPVAGARLAVVGGGIQLSGGTTAQEGIRIQRASGYASITGINNDNNAFNPIAFFTGASEAARISSVGTLFVGGTSNPGPIPNRIVTTANGADGVEHILCNELRSTAGTENYFRFYRNNVLVGSISNTLSNTAYNTSSDYRLKHDIQPMSGALAKVVALKPCTYKWNVDNSDGEGFIAHELAEVCPGAVYGEKDAVNEDNSIKPQGIDTSFLVATLTAAIQELKAELDITKAKVAALEAK